MGELRQRGNVWWIRYYRNGKRYEESARSAKKGAAIELLKLREGDGAHGVPVTPKIGRLRFEAAVGDVVNDYKTNGRRSLAHVERRIALHLTPYFGGRRMAAITTDDIRGYIAKRQADTEMVRSAHDVTRKDGSVRHVAEQRRPIARVSNAEINREIAIVKRAFKLALESRTLLYAPHVPMLKEASARAGFFERAAFEDVRAALPEALRGVVTFAYLTGWRIPSEVLPLTWAQVDRKAKTIRLDPGTTKNAEGRTLPYDLLPELCTVLDDQWTAHERLVTADEMICPFVFHRQGDQIKEFRRAWQAACEAAGVPGRIPHDFRRTAVRNLVRAGVPEHSAMKITGHKTRSVFDRYDIVNEADVRESLGKLADAAGTKKGQSARKGRTARFRRSA